MEAPFIAILAATALGLLLYKDMDKSLQEMLPEFAKTPASSSRFPIAFALSAVIALAVLFFIDPQLIQARDSP